MMEISLFLGRFFGMYLIIVGGAYLLRQNTLRNVINDFYDSPALVMVTAVFTLIMGLLILLSHQVWELNWRGFITLLGYLTFFKGVIHLYVPGWGSRFAQKLSEGRGYTYMGIAVIIIGIYLCTVTFFH